MILQICAMFDRAAQTYGRPFFVHNSAVAVRSLTDELKNPESELARHPEDYDLYDIGAYDDDDASITTYDDGPKLIVRAQDLVVRPS